ncbi:Lipoprotein signal peptidase [Dissostichus eleginoides]|uniref:Lipoprotein signal peptidase n=1 Tax=Dissostichus eleginoides TaxID=100907 RepID=A0AAD9C8W6_DISEL|nr:Lipoprotein signal peptidase [Dissostichus eleginoides]
MQPPAPASLVSGKGGWARWFYQGFLLNPSLTLPQTKHPSEEVDTSLPVKVQSIERVVGQTTVRATTQSSSHCLSGEESRDNSCELRLLYRQQSNYLNQHGLLMHGCVALDSGTPQVSVEVKEALCIRHNFRNMHMSAALICLQTRHIWWLPAAEVSNTGLVPPSVAEVPTGQPAHEPSHCLFFRCSD